MAKSAGNKVGGGREGIIRLEKTIVNNEKNEIESNVRGSDGGRGAGGRGKS